MPTSKKVTEDNWEIFAAFLNISPGGARSMIGEWVTWEDIHKRPQEAVRVHGDREPIFAYTTVSDSYMANEITNRQKHLNYAWVRTHDSVFNKWSIKRLDNGLIIADNLVDEEVAKAIVKAHNDSLTEEY